MSGGASGGTLESILNVFDSGSAKEMMNPFYLNMKPDYAKRRLRLCQYHLLFCVNSCL